jgi:hypothetical protein
MVIQSICRESRHNSESLLEKPHAVQTIGEVPSTLWAQKAASINSIHSFPLMQVSETHVKALAEEAQSATATARLRKYMA